MFRKGEVIDPTVLELSDEGTTLVELPPDALVHLFYFIDTYTIITTISCVHSAFRDILQHDDLIWRVMAERRHTLLLRLKRLPSDLLWNFDIRGPSALVLNRSSKAPPLLEELFSEHESWKATFCALPSLTFEQTQYIHWFDTATGLNETDLLKGLKSQLVKTDYVLPKCPLGGALGTWAQDALIYASEMGFTRVVKWIFKVARAVIDPSRDQSKCLRVACEHSHIPIVKLLLKDRRVQPEAQSNNSLITASKSGCLPIVKALLRNQRVDPSAKGGMALVYASNYGHLDVVKVLMKHSKTDPTSMSYAAIRQAFAKGHEAIVEYYFRHPKMRGHARDSILRDETIV